MDLEKNIYLIMKSMNNYDRVLGLVELPDSEAESFSRVLETKSKGNRNYYLSFYPKLSAKDWLEVIDSVNEETDYSKTWKEELKQIEEALENDIYELDKIEAEHDNNLKNN